jgi:hypothetical protein
MVYATGGQEGDRLAAAYLDRADKRGFLGLRRNIEYEFVREPATAGSAT